MFLHEKMLKNDSSIHFVLLKKLDKTFRPEPKLN